MAATQVTALASLFVVASAGVQPLWTYGHAAYAYGEVRCSDHSCDEAPSCNSARWAGEIAAFNANTSISNAQINTVYSYGGDVEFWPKDEGSTACFDPAKEGSCNYSAFYDPINQKAAQAYTKASGVKQVVSMLEGRLDGWHQITTYNNHDACGFGNFYPNLKNLSDQQITKLAEQTARLYCADTNLGGIQVRLEPYEVVYKESIEAFLVELVKEFEDSDGVNGCRVAMHPKGRTVGFFGFAHKILEMRPDFAETVLGRNGYFVFSGYDLVQDPSFSPTSLDQFEANLKKEIDSIRKVIQGSGKIKFTLAVPLAASQHEYEQYVPASPCGPACQPHESNVTMAAYVQKMFQVITSTDNIGLFTVKEGGQFLGLSFWTWAHEVAYPRMKWFNNQFYPATPTPEVLDILKVELPKLGHVRRV